MGEGSFRKRSDKRVVDWKGKLNIVAVWFVCMVKKINSLHTG